MVLSLRTLMSMVRGSVVSPRQGAAEVMRLHLPPIAGWMALALMAIASAMLSHLSFASMPADAREFFGDAMRSPIRTALVQWAAMLVSVHLVYRIGRWRGGTGSLADTVLLVAWLQFILLVLQAIQIVVQVAIPSLGGILSIASVVLLFWLLTNFVAQLHGFRSLPMTFAGIVLTMLVTAFVLAMFFVLLFGMMGPKG